MLGVGAGTLPCYVERAFCSRSARSSAHSPSRPDAAAHLGRGGLGVGEAEDLLRLDPGQQQPQHALGEHMVLPDPALASTQTEAAGIGGGALLRDDVFADDDAAAHSLSSPSLTRHSSTRAR
jgi:hypothetical protein